jgi:hypothetical protein
MKTAWLCFCALLLAALSTFARADSKADIDQLEKDFNAAYAANDLDKYFGYYAADAILWFPEGRTDVPSYRKMWTAYIKGFQETDVWFKGAAGWKIAQVHYSPAPPAGHK